MRPNGEPQSQPDARRRPNRLKSRSWTASGQELGAGDSMELTMTALELSRLGNTVVKSNRKLVLPLMAGRTKCDQVVQSIVAQSASHREMMYLQVFR